MTTKKVKCPACDYEIDEKRYDESLSYGQCPDCDLPYAFFEWINGLISRQYKYAEDDKSAYFFITRNGKEIRITIRKDELNE